MKKFIAVMLILVLMLLSGCSLPINKTPDDSGEKQEQNVGDGESQGVTAGVYTDVESEDDENVVKVSVTLYYQTSDGILVPVTRKFAKQDGIAKAAMTGLTDSSINREEVEYYGLYPILPKDTQILGLTIKEGIAVLDLSENVLDYKDALAERNIFSAIVYTLTEFESIEHVSILIDGEVRGKLKYGTDISGLLNRKNVQVNSSNLNLKNSKKKLDIYLYKNVNGRYNYILPVSVEYSEKKDESEVSRLVELLGSKYDEKGLYTNIPENTKLLGSSVQDDVLTLDFNEELISYGGGTERENGIIKQLAHSIQQIEGAKKVKLLINGEEAQLPEGSDIADGIEIPSEINNYID